MKQRNNKTIMCSVLFMDIVEYSKKSVSGQIALKNGFNTFLAAAIRNVPTNDRIILDTGDGAAISFMGDIEDALRTALILREKLLSEGVNMDPPLLVRMGINLGPVRLVKDINGQPNMVGDGINVAQRVMGFADVGQIMVSRSYHEAVSRLSHEYAEMFDYHGPRTDKHVREHEIYEVSRPGNFVTAQQKQGNKGTLETASSQRISAWIQAARNGFRNASRRRRALYVANFASATLLVIVVTTKMIIHRQVAPLPQVAGVPAESAVMQTEAIMEQAASVVAEASPNEAVRPVVKRVVKKKAGSKTVQPVQQKPKEVSAEPQKASNKVIVIRSPEEVAAVKPSAKMRTLEETTAVNPSAKVRTLEETTAVVKPGIAALVSIAVTPWGEVYLDGRIQGVSPPLAELQVAPGRHEIEIRNSIFPVHSRVIYVKAGEKIKIKHKFVN